ncbi:MAG TPA: phospholipase D-like domain-containing protein [Candidatus Dormibacteraeota bacterium]|nr:phospholipase D-like domain-containing protein [Candidatus Dormibacteraeota bacterium]
MPSEGRSTDRREAWFLTSSERGNDFTALDRRRPDGLAWSTGNRVETLVHGAVYFGRLLAAIRELGPGDQLYFTDWRGDPDQLLSDDPDSEIGAVLAAAARRGVQVKGLLWRSHLDKLGFSAEENRNLGEECNAAGGEVLLDQRVRLGGSHHQKLVVIRHADIRERDSDRSERDVAFVGGIDLCHSRRDDADHHGDRQRQAMAPLYGDRPPWHDAQVAVQGPAVGDLEFCFRERWEDRGRLSRDPLGIMHDLLRHTHRKATPLPPMAADPEPRGTHAVQVLRTYARRHGGYPFAPHGERSVARGFRKAIQRARRLIYIEDQFVWSTEVANVFAAALVASPSLHLIVLLPRYFDQDRTLTLRPNQVGREQAVSVLKDAAGDRVAIYDIENLASVPVYVHAKISVIDDVWASVGSDNFNRRSWSHDSEIACAVLDDERDVREPVDPAGLGDGARKFARDLRLQLWREHLGRAEGDDRGLLDPAAAVGTFRDTAQALERWHLDGRRGVRPPGRVRPHPRIQPSSTTRLWAEPFYRTVYDPDARTPEMRRKAEW